MNKKIPLFIFLVVVIIAAVGAYLWHLSMSQGSPETSDTTTLSDIPAPAGWQAERQDFSRIIFVKDGEGITPNRIDVDALKEHGTLDQEIARDDDNIPSGSATATSTAHIGWNGIPMDYLNGNRVPVGWAVINGNLILVANDREADAGTSIDYLVFHNGVVYMFSTAYQLYNPTGKRFDTINTDGLQTIQAMVQNFAQNLPAETYPQ